MASSNEPKKKCTANDPDAAPVRVRGTTFIEDTVAAIVPPRPRPWPRTISWAAAAAAGYDFVGGFVDVRIILFIPGEESMDPPDSGGRSAAGLRRCGRDASRQVGRGNPGEGVGQRGEADPPALPHPPLPQGACVHNP